jgi:DNA-binding transcriptional MerR regulator
MVDNVSRNANMKKNYLVKEFAGLTKVTVRTLHYYDQIGLLKPSFEMPSGYRVYTDADLLRLQQIVTLKFMGFSLARIRDLLNLKGYEVVRSLRIQAEAVRDEIGRLKRATRAIDQVLARLESGGRINRKKLIEIMEVIQMGEDVKKAWQEKFFTEGELREFQEIGKKYPPRAMAGYQRRWAELIDEVKKNLNADPAGEVAQSLARRWKDLLDEAYGGHPELKVKIGKAYAAGAIPEDHRMFGPEVWDFIKKAHEAAKKR